MLSNVKSQGIDACTAIFLSNCMLLKTYKVYSLLTDTIITLSVGQNQGDEYPKCYDNQKEMCLSLIALGCESQKESLASRSLGEYQHKPLPFLILNITVQLKVW